MRVRFWGVRGSVPWATPDSIVHGCNTPCLELRDEARGATLILDAGSGLVGLGESLTEARGAVPRPVPILLTHYHWDHTQGLPFFSPLYQSGWQPTIWGPALDAVPQAWAETIFQPPYFPMSFDRLPNRPRILRVNPGRMQIEGFDIAALPLNHPGGAYAYRIRGAQGDLVYATDHEFGMPAIDAALADFCRGAAALVADAHFTPEELLHYAGWGHASWQQACEHAAAWNVGRLYLFHHKPGRSDLDMAEIECQSRALFPNTIAAREGLTFDV
jgi:phosphoribosyl 1,2-cyclic phosphodiesterase